jgi:hypothetical protein
LTLLRDGSLLDIHHLSSTGEVDNLALRLAHRFLQRAEKHPEAMLRQVVIFAPIDRSGAERTTDRGRLGYKSKVESAHRPMRIFGIGNRCQQ